MRSWATLLLPFLSTCTCFSWNANHPKNGATTIQQRSSAFVVTQGIAPGPLQMSPTDDDTAGDEEGMKLANEFFNQIKDMGLDSDLRLDDDEEEDEDDDEEEDVQDIPTSAVNVFQGRDEGGVGKLAGNVTFTNKELYSSLKERVLESPSAFVDLVSPPNEEDESEESKKDSGAPEYKPPKTVPDPELTAGEVVTTVLSALNHNDVPERNTGIGILFDYSSPGSILKSPDKAPTHEEYADFLKTSEYKVLLEHTLVIIDKADYSYDKKKAFFTVRLKVGKGREFTSVNFILSTKGSDDDDCWLIDSILIRPEGIGRRGRR